MIWALLGKYWPALAGLVIAFGIYQAGVNAERSRGEAASLRIQVETLRRDKKIADDALMRAANDTAELDAANRVNEEKIDQLQEIIRARHDPGISQRELDGLLSIK